jgi:MFS family permease
LIGISVFLTGTAITLLATDLRFLIVGRVIQGVGAGGMNPLCIALISDRFPPGERGKALGTWNSMGPAAGVIGPFLAGFLIDHLGWYTIFGPVLLVGMVALFAVKELVPPTGRDFVQPGFLRTLDWGGAVLLGASIMMLVFYVSSRPITGIDALRDWRLLALTVLFFGSFLFWEKRHSHPFIALNIFASKSFSRASLGAAIRMFSMSGIGFLMPLYIADVHALSAVSIGSMLMLHAGALLATMRIGGQLADRWGSSRWPVMMGSSMQVGAMVGFALLPGTAPLGLVVVGLAAHGLGAGIFLAALHRSAMGGIAPDQTGMAAGLYSMFRFGGTVLGTALGGVVLQYGLDRYLLTIDAYQMVFWFIAAVATLGVVIGWGLQE